MALAVIAMVVASNDRRVGVDGVLHLAAKTVPGVDHG